MYKEVAVDPACMADSACFFALREQFGFEKGRYLVADRQHWLKDAMVAVKAAQSSNELKPVMAQTIKSWLNKARGKVELKDRQILLPLNRVVHPEVPVWNAWWLRQQSIRKFDVSIAPAPNPPLAYDFTQLSSVQDWNVSPSCSVDRSAADIVAALEPLLRISREVWLVDNYFNLGSNQVLVELIRAAASRGFTQLKIVTACDCASPEAVWRREYESLVSDTFKCEWVKVPDNYFHDRYLITDTGAVKAGHGFAEAVRKGTAADKVSLNYCSFDEAQTVQQQVQALLAENKAGIIWSN